MPHTFTVHWSADKNGRRYRDKTPVTAKSPDSARNQMLEALKTEGFSKPKIRKVKR